MLKQFSKRMTGVAFVLSLLLLLQGCVSSLKSKAELDRLTQRRGLGTFYYIGTSDGFHYFVSDYFLERTKHYRLPEKDYFFQNSFPKTKVKTKWVPYSFNWNANSKGFYGEPKEHIQSTNQMVDPPKEVK